MPAWIHVGNGYGKMIDETQVREFGELETPIVLTCTLCVWQAADALKAWMYTQPGMGEHTVNPLVGETNDSLVNDMWANPVTKADVFAALNQARGGRKEVSGPGGALRPSAGRVASAPARACSQSRSEDTHWAFSRRPTSEARSS